MVERESALMRRIKTNFDSHTKSSVNVLKFSRNQGFSEAELQYMLNKRRKKGLDLLEGGALDLKPNTAQRLNVHEHSTNAERHKMHTWYILSIY